MIHETADVDDNVAVSPTASVWHYAQVRSGARIGDDTIIGRGVYIGRNVRIGKRCKIQNYACIYGPTILEDGVFVGPHVVITNDKYPRAITGDGKLKAARDWHAVGVRVGKGASIGAGAVLLSGIRVGAWAAIGMGAVVIYDVAPRVLVAGCPAEEIGLLSENWELGHD